MDMPSQENKIWFAVSMLLIGVIVGFTAAKLTESPVGNAPTPTAQGGGAQSSPSAPKPPEYSDIKAIDPKEDHIQGSANAPISIIEYSDLQCPYCARVHPTLKQVLSQYTGKVNWVFRHYPLSFHPYAQKAAEATECAAEQGGDEKFWAMVDTIFEKGADTAKLEEYAKAIGLKENAFAECLKSGKYASKTSEMMQSGSKVGVRGTPASLIVNHVTKKVVFVSGAQPFDSFKTTIDTLLSGK
jgi:protein-disulfide isomerase